MTPPYPLLWLRYSAFIILYPLGVASELTMAYLALPNIGTLRPLSVAMPNSANFAFDYYLFCWLAIVAYVPGATPAFCEQVNFCKSHSCSAYGEILEHHVGIGLLQIWCCQVARLPIDSCTD